MFPGHIGAAFRTATILDPNCSAAHFDLARALARHPVSASEAAELLQTYIERFPEGKEFDTARSALQKLLHRATPD